MIYKKRGYSLLELMLVLAIVAGLVALAFMSYKNVHDKIIAKRTSDDIFLIINSIKEVYGENPKPSNVTNYTILISAIKSNITNTDMVVGTSEIKLPYGNVLISPGSGSSVPGFYIQYTLPNSSSPKLCIDIANNLYADMSNTDTLYFYSSSDSNYINKTASSAQYSVAYLTQICQNTLSITYNTAY